MKTTLIISILAYTIGTMYPVQPQNNDNKINVEVLADAIYRAEGGDKAVKPYGILSVSCDGEVECRRICINTIRNNIKRYNNYGHEKYDDYLSFLGSRYAPVGADNDNGTNRHWVSNTRAIYKQLTRR